MSESHQSHTDTGMDMERSKQTGTLLAHQLGDVACKEHQTACRPFCWSNKSHSSVVNQRWWFADDEWANNAMLSERPSCAAAHIKKQQHIIRTLWSTTLSWCCT